MLRKPSLALAGVATALAAMLASAAPASAATNCDGVASPGPGAVQQLLDSLRPGQTGCLHGGAYAENVKVTTPGITLTRFGNERAQVKGRFWIARGADGVTVEGLYLDGTNRDSLPSPTVNASDATFRRNDVTNYHHSICFVLGHPDWGRRRRRAHRVQPHPRLRPPARRPTTTTASTSPWRSNALIRGNWIYDNADYGVQLYPDAQDTKVVGNVIDGNGEGLTFSGDYGLAPNGNIVEGNVIANSRLRNNIQSWYPPGNPIGHGNVARDNCVKGGAYDHGNGGIASQWGFRVLDNTRVQPDYADRAARDFRVVGGPCRALLGVAYSSRRPRPRRPARPRLAGQAPLPGVRLRRGSPEGAPRPPAAAAGPRPRRASRRPGRDLRPRHGHRRLLARVRVRANGAFALRPRVRAPRHARFVRAQRRGARRRALAQHPAADRAPVASDRLTARRGIFLAPFEELSEPRLVAELAAEAEAARLGRLLRLGPRRLPAAGARDRRSPGHPVRGGARDGAAEDRRAGHAAAAPPYPPARARDGHARPAQRRAVGLRRRHGAARAPGSSTRSASARRATCASARPCSTRASSG